VLHVEIAYPLGTAALFAVALSGWRGLTVVTPMGEDVLVVKDASYGFRRFPVPRLLVSWTLRRAGAIRCISPLIRKLVDEEWPGPPAHTIPLNVASWALSLNEEPAETRRSRRSRARQTLLARSGIPDAPLVVALGRLHPFKGMDVLVEALRGVPSAHLLIAGPSLEVRPFGDAAKHLADIARARGLEERVHLLGSIPPGEALAILAAADVVAVPSYQESLNRVCIEAAAVGTPFVVTETTGIAAYVPDRGVGLIVPPRSPPALAEALSQVIDGRWSPDAAQASAFVRRFAPERIGEDMLGLYQSVGTASRRAGD
jgi:glycosyltransferase involved in cell wall biosynthesis